MLAFTLLRRDFKENDESISFYTKETGKVEAIARGVKKIISKNTSSFEPFSLLDIELIKGKETIYVTKAIVLENFSGIRERLPSLLVGNFILNNLESSTRIGQKDEKMFLLTYDFLKTLNNSAPSSLFSSAYLVQLWSSLGFAPDLSDCRMCHSKNEKEYFFDKSRGRIVCGKCNLIAKNQNVLKVGNIQTLRKISKECPDEVQKIKIIEDDIPLIKKVLKEFVEFHGGSRVVWEDQLLGKKSNEADLRRGK